MPLQQVVVSPMDITTDPSGPNSQSQSPTNVPLSHNTNDCCSSQTSSLSSNGYDICRICHCEGDTDVPLIEPCYCSGSLRYVHQACLQQWIKSSNIRCCELCKFQFIMQTKTKPFTEWEHLEMSGMERRKLLCAVLFHVVALTCVIWSLYVLIDRTYEEIKIGSLEWPFWTKLIVVAIGFTGGVVFMYIQCKAYLHICQRWKAYNRVIYVQNAPEKTHLPSPQHPPRSNNVPESHIVQVIQEQPPPVYPSQTTAAADPNARPDPRSNEKRSIDLKNVRNLHIFFNDENRIRVQDDEKTSRHTDCAEPSNSSSPENNAIIPKTSEPETIPTTTSGGTSWHIQIEKTSKESNKVNESRCIEDVSPGDNLDSRQYRNGNEDYKVTCNDSAESPVLKLQIKKAEIVIKFGNENDSSMSENGGPDEDGNDDSVNINIKSDEGQTKRPSLELLAPTEGEVKTSESQRQDDEGSEDSLSGCGSPTCRLLPYSEPIDYSTTSSRPKSYPFDKRQSRNFDSWSPGGEKPVVSSDHGAGSQSPLLAQRDTVEKKRGVDL